MNANFKLPFEINHGEFEEIRRHHRETITKLVREHQIKLKGLIESQFVTCILQAIQSGDFVRNVYIGREGEGSQIVYIPYRGIEEAQSEITRLQKILEANNIQYTHD